MSNEKKIVHIDLSYDDGLRLRIDMKEKHMTVYRNGSVARKSVHLDFLASVQLIEEEKQFFWNTANSILKEAQGIIDKSETRCTDCGQVDEFCICHTHMMRD